MSHQAKTDVPVIERLLSPGPEGTLMLMLDVLQTSPGRGPERKVVRLHVANNLSYLIRNALGAFASF